jgi:hypothetical protein
MTLKKMSKITKHHVATILDKEFATKKFSSCDDLDGILEQLLDNTEDFRPPFTLSECYVIKESLPLYGGGNFKENSDLHTILSDAPDEVALAVDSVMRSIVSLHFIAVKPKHLVQKTIEEWLYLMQDYELLVRPFGDSNDYVLITKLITFKKDNK